MFKKGDMRLALPVNIKDLISNKIVESDRIEFKTGWNPKEILHVMCGFANDYQNWGGGYIVIGIEAVDGKATMPPIGLDPNTIDKINGELLYLSNLISPNYFPIVKEEIIRKKYVLIVWCPAGDHRPYNAPQSIGKGEERYYYIRKNARTLKAKDLDLQLLMSQAARIPYDDRMNVNSSIEDLDLGLIREFLKDVNSDLFTDSAKLTLKEICRQMLIVKGPDEAIKPTNVGLLFFSKNPQKYHERARIELVVHEGYSGRQFYEKIFRGPIHHQVRDVLRYIRAEIIKEYVIKNKTKAESRRYYNFPFEAVEEIVTNAVYHKSYEINNPIEIQVFPDRLDVLSYPGPLPPLDNKQLKNKRNILAREYRNRRIGDLLKELNLTEGRGTGIPIVYHSCEVNGSPPPVFETNDERSYFLATLFSPDAPEEAQFIVNTPSKETRSKSIKKVLPKNHNLTETHQKIINSIKLDSSISRQLLSKKLKLSVRTLQRNLDELKAMNLIRRHGSFMGYWEILD